MEKAKLSSLSNKESNNEVYSSLKEIKFEVM